MRNNLQLKVIVCGERKTPEATQSTAEDEFKVNLEENNFSEWHESWGTAQRIPG
jgi:hypothetical protein